MIAPRRPGQPPKPFSPVTSVAATIGGHRGVSHRPEPGTGTAEGPDTGTPEVSVVIPTRDRWTLLRRSLSAALGQRDVALEVIVVDDGSSDETASELPVVAQNEPRVRHLRQATSAGVARARNRGILAAHGEWVAFLDDDDFWAPQRTRRMLDAASAAGADVVISGSVAVDATGQVLRVDPATVVDIPRALRTQNVMGGPSDVMVRRTTVEALGGFDEGLSVWADYELWLRLADSGARITACPDVLNGYFVDPGGMHVRDAGLAVREFELLLDRYGRARAPGDPGIHDQLFTRWLARAHRKGGSRRQAVALYLRNAIRHGGVGDLVRAVGTLMGERAMSRLAPPPGPAAAPDWLALYRPEDGSSGLVPLHGAPAT